MNPQFFFPSFAATSPAFLAHAVSYMQDRFLVQNLIPGSSRATLEGLTLAVLTSHREVLLKSRLFDATLPKSIAMEIWGKLFDGFQDHPFLGKAYELAGPGVKEHDLILDAAACGIFGALEVVYENRWSSHLSYLPIRTFWSLALALETLHETDLALAVLRKAPTLGIRNGAWITDLEYIACQLADRGDDEAANAIREEIGRHRH